LAPFPVRVFSVPWQEEANGRRGRAEPGVRGNGFDRCFSEKKSVHSFVFLKVLSTFVVELRIHGTIDSVSYEIGVFLHRRSWFDMFLQP